MAAAAHARAACERRSGASASGRGAGLPGLASRLQSLALLVELNHGAPPGLCSPPRRKWGEFSPNSGASAREQ